MVPKNTICLWYDGTALDAAKFYAETFPDSAWERYIMRRSEAGRRRSGASANAPHNHFSGVYQIGEV